MSNTRRVQRVKKVKEFKDFRKNELGDLYERLLTRLNKESEYGHNYCETLQQHLHDMDDVSPNAIGYDECYRDGSEGIDSYGCMYA